jgi:hypothetical protein
VVHGEQQTHLIQNQAALDVLCSSRQRAVPFGASDLQDLGSPLVSRRPLSEALTAFSAMHSFGMGVSSVQFRVRAPFRSRASAHVGFISPLCPGQHRRLRPSFAR